MIRRTLFTIVLSGLLMAALAGPATAAGGSDYLASRQGVSGGFSEPGGPAAVSLTEWAVMGLAAAGRHPATMHRSGGHTAGHFLASKASWPWSPCTGTRPTSPAATSCARFGPRSAAADASAAS